MQFEFLFDRGRTAQPEHEWLRVGARQVRLRLVRHPRARRYVLRLCADGAARVTIPRGGSWAEGRRFANRNLRWLEKQLVRQLTGALEPKLWVAGTEILFRGERVPLHVTPEQSSVCFGGQVVCLPVQTEGLRYTSPGQRPGIINQILPLQAERLPHNPWLVSANLRSIVEKHLWRLASLELPARVAELAQTHGFQVHRVTVRNQRSRWGSCSKHGTISLNWRLVQTPAFVRDYIILHELAHLKEMNHSNRFWRAVARICPEFARAELWLKEHSGLLR